MCTITHNRRFIILIKSFFFFYCSCYSAGFQVCVTRGRAHLFPYCCSQRCKLLLHVDTYEDRIRVKWESAASVTSCGSLQNWDVFNFPFYSGSGWGCSRRRRRRPRRRKKRRRLFLCSVKLRLLLHQPEEKFTSSCADVSGEKQQVPYKFTERTRWTHSLVTWIRLRSFVSDKTRRSKETS